MTREASLAWSWLNILNKKRYDRILERYGDLDEALLHLDEEFFLWLGCREDGMRESLTRLAKLDIEAYDTTLRRANVTLLSLEDDVYPARLKATADPPIFLSVQGSLLSLSQPSAALVGTRQMTPYGRRVAQECTAACVRAGLVTVSGLAEGIDGEVARETLRAGGTHVAVLGHGLGRIFPKVHEGLAADILASGGALVSEYAFDAEATPYSFVGRNRIIAGLALATAVLEAPAKSGALHTAQFALDEGREVLAAPGQLFDAHWEGSLTLIASGQARLIVRPEDIPSALGIDVTRGAPATDYEPQSPDEAAVLAALTSVPQPIDTIVLACKLPAGTVIATLTMLELAGAARNSGGGQWVRG